MFIFLNCLKLVAAYQKLWYSYLKKFHWGPKASKFGFHTLEDIILRQIQIDFVLLLAKHFIFIIILNYNKFSECFENLQTCYWT
jgi:hypothetical protein